MTGVLTDFLCCPNYQKGQSFLDSEWHEHKVVPFQKTTFQHCYWNTLSWAVKEYNEPEATARVQQTDDHLQSRCMRCNLQPLIFDTIFEHYFPKIRHCAIQRISNIFTTVNDFWTLFDKAFEWDIKGREPSELSNYRKQQKVWVDNNFRIVSDRISQCATLKFLSSNKCPGFNLTAKIHQQERKISPKTAQPGFEFSSFEDHTISISISAENSALKDQVKREAGNLTRFFSWCCRFEKWRQNSRCNFDFHVKFSCSTW